MTPMDVSLTRNRPAVADYPPGATFGPRILQNFELVWLLSGRARWICHGDGGTELTLEPGTLLLTRPGMRDEYRWDERTPSRHGYVHFTMSPVPAQLPLLRPIAEPGPLAGLLGYLLWLAEEPGPGWAERCEEVIGLIMKVFIEGPLPAEARDTVEPPPVAAALDYVRQTWAQRIRPVTLSELAHAAGTSKAHLARLFRQHLGVGAVTALELVRLARAETLLTRSNLTVTQISRDCGFADPLHFSRRFKASYGTSPRAYRNTGGTTSPLATAGLLPLTRRLDVRHATPTDPATVAIEGDLPDPEAAGARG